MAAADRHGPEGLSSYLSNHSTILQQFKARHFVIAGDLELSAFGNRLLEMSSELRCLGGIVLDVRKAIRVVANDGREPRVQTSWYSYNARVQGVGNILRYDAPHTHRPIHHVHRFDVFAGDKEGAITETIGGDWPHVGEVLEELEAFYFEHYDALEHFDS